jgi:hypothetical protein
MKNIETFLIGIKELRREVNADKTKHMIMSRDQYSRRSNSIKNGVNSFERVEEFKNLETTLIDHNSVQEGINIRLNSVNSCYKSLHNFTF